MTQSQERLNPSSFCEIAGSRLLVRCRINLQDATTSTGIHVYTIANPTQGCLALCSAHYALDEPVRSSSGIAHCCKVRVDEWADRADIWSRINALGILGDEFLPPREVVAFRQVSMDTYLPISLQDPADLRHFYRIQSKVAEVRLEAYKKRHDKEGNYETLESLDALFNRLTSFIRDREQAWRAVRS